MRVLINPHDAAAFVRALARPPIELRQVHLALVIQLARRRKLDLVHGLRAATEAPQVPPEARERIQRFVELHRRAAAAFEALAPDEFTASLIETLRTRGRALLAPAEAGRQRASLERLRQVVVDFARRRPGSTPRELAAHLLALASEGRWTEPRAEARSARGEPAAGEQPPPADDHAGERREGRPPRRALARPVPAPQGGRPGAVGIGHRDVPQLSAEVQVLARPAHSHRADAGPALRDHRASGARALSRRGRQHAEPDARAA